ncbi:MAG TPA: regulatory signaling modulator protein AmpE [Rhodanobacteraceae bacterium]|jgi:AmpE protein|nr:regulatory signaling modulator protein AmpE [Rhodanobacteraceae bacterium]
MAKILLAIVLVLATMRALPDLARLRDFSWLRVWLARWHGDGEHSARPILLLPALVFVFCALIQGALDHVLFGLPLFAFAAVVLFFCWGPRDLDADIEGVLKAPDRDQRAAAAQALSPDAAASPLPLEATALVEAAFDAALTRWFGVLFWFVLLGPAGALGYRMVQLIARNAAFTDRLDARESELVERAARILDWAPAHLMALTLALVSDFDAVLRTWREYHAAHGRGYFTLDLGFLGALARAGVDADVMAGDGYATDVDDPLDALGDARRVLWRILVAWLAVLAVMVLAGWVS